MVVKTSVSFVDFKKLIQDSEIHKNWTASDIKRIMMPLIKKRQAYFAYKDNKIQGMVTWAWLSEDTVEGYLTRTKPLTPETLTKDEGEFWCIDFIAPYGNAKEVNKAFKREFKKVRPEITKARMLRREKGYDSSITIR